MHILLIHQAFATLDEAGGTRHYELARHLVSHGHRVTVITSPVSYLTGKSQQAGFKWFEQEFPEPGITVLRCYTYSALHRSFFHRFLGFISFMISSFFTGISLKDIDLVWGTTPPIFQSATAWLLARLKRVPFLLEVRDLWPAFAIAVGVLKNSLLIKASLWLESFLYRHADQVIVNSPGFINHVTQRGANRVELITNGVDPTLFDPSISGDPIRQKYHLEGKFIVLYAGAHGMSNDLGVVLLSAQILNQNEHIQFIFVGDGKEKKKLEQEASNLALNHVLFLPAVPKTEMQNLLSASDLCIAILKPIELYKTTYPNKVFDYMAASRPVLLAIDGVIREVVEAGQAGVTVPPGNAQAMAEAILSLSKNPEQARQMGISGREYVIKNFNRQDAAVQLENLLEKMREKYA